MAQATPLTNIEAHIQGDIHGQVAIGTNILQIGSIHGGVVNIAMPGQIAPPRPRPTPIFLRPRPFPGLLDRHMEAAAALAALGSAEPAEFTAEAGMGKTSLLRHVAYAPVNGAFPDGIIYLSARQQPVADLLQFLFDAFYESDKSVKLKPDDAQVRHALQDKRALILLDNVDLVRDDVQALMDAAPACAFLMASEERRLWGEGRTLALRGLPTDDAVTLFERELGRPLTAEERPAAEALCAALQGHPLRILQAAALAREENRPIAALAGLMQAAVPGEALTAEALAALSEPEQRVVKLLAVFGGATLHAEHLSALTGLPDIASVIEPLLRRGLVQGQSSRYSLAGTLVQAVQQSPDVSRWAERALRYFTRWADSNRQAPSRIVEEAAAILHLVKWAAEAGRWRETLRLVVAVDGALTLSGRWGAWDQALQAALRAARALRNQPAEAWALHQIGTRALCLGYTPAARTALIQALRLRESFEDYRGAAVTRHNLNILLGPPTPPREPPRQPPSAPSPAVPPTPGVPLFVKALIGALIMALGIAGAAWALSPQNASLPTPTAPVITQTPTHMPTHTPTMTQTPTATHTATPTPADTPTPTGTPTFTPTPSLTPCYVRFDWPVYTVKLRDTLFSIGRVTGATVDELKRANCLTSDWIYPGQPLRVPRLPPTATPTPTTIPAVSLSRSRLDFDNQRVGTSSTPQAVTLTSIGSALLAVHSVTLTGDNSDDFTQLSDNCTGARLAPGSSCVISISFAPKAAGVRSALLTIADNAADSPQIVSLSGIGVGVPVVRLTPNSLDFGQQRVGTRSEAQNVTLTNIGSDLLTLSNVIVDDVIALEAQVQLAFQGYPSDFIKLADNCTGASLAPGNSCTISIIFVPKATGVRSGILIITDNAADSPQRVPLSGIGTVPRIDFSADRTSIVKGECLNLKWQIESMRAAYLSGGEFNNLPVTSQSGKQDACPKMTTIYTLRVVLFDGSEETRNVTITVTSIPVGPPDLQVIISVPVSTTVGSNIRVTAQVQNMGNGPAPGTNSSGSNGYMVDIVLSSDTSVPAGWAIYSSNYREDVLLIGGRHSNTSDLAPGQSTAYRYDRHTIPGDTPIADPPASNYYICARVDPGNVVAESDEKNNVSCALIWIHEVIIN